MTLWRYLAGLGVLLATLGPLYVAAWRLRQRFLPEWVGAIARLAEAVTVIAALCMVGQLLGAVGLFATAPVTFVCAGVGLAGAAFARRGPRGPADARPPMVVPAVRRAEVLVAVAVVALVAGLWSTWVAQSFNYGIGNGDTVWYHLPFAVRFAQTGWLTHAQFVNGEAFVTYYPANASLLHAVGMLAFGRDVLSLVLNFALLPLALLAGWCVGRRAGVAPASLIAVALVLALPVMATSQPGTAKDDVLSLALLVASVAFLINAPRRVMLPTALSGIAAGLAIATKLTALTPVIAMALALLVLTRRRLRLTTMLTWGSALVVTGSYWYVRNLVIVGNPIPSLGLSLPSPPSPSYTRYGSTLGEFLTNGDVYHRVFAPGLEQAFGPAWVAILLIAIIGAVLALIVGSHGAQVTGISVLATVGAYVITPGTAFAVDATHLSADGRLAVVFIFAYNLRYLTPTLALGLVLLPQVQPLRESRWRWVLLLTLTALVFVTETSGAGGNSWASGHAMIAIVVMAVVVVGYLARERLGSAFAPGVVISLGALLAIAAWLPIRDYLRTRYELAPVEPWVRNIHDRDIAIAGFVVQYPLAGDDLSNRVQYIGRRGASGSFAPYQQCLPFRRAVHMSYDYLVTPTTVPTGDLGLDLARWRLGQPGGEPPNEPPEVGWAERDPRLRRVFKREGVTVYKVRRGVSDVGC